VTTGTRGTRSVALLRGINVGGHNRVAMGALREVLENMGLVGVATYLQSGNVLFNAARGDRAEVLAARIKDGIAAGLGVDVEVVIRSATELDDVVGRSPLGGDPDNPARYFVAFLSGVADPVLAREIESQPLGDNRIWISGAEVFLWCPGGFSVLGSLSAVEKRLALSATSRNWNTVTRLASLARA